MIAKKQISDSVRREIEVRAYLIWESEGRPHGYEKEHWARAEAEVLAPMKTATAAPAKTVAPAKKAAPPATKATPKAAVAAKVVIPTKTKKTTKSKPPKSR